MRTRLLLFLLIVLGGLYVLLSDLLDPSMPVDATAQIQAPAHEVAASNARAEKIPANDLYALERSAFEPGLGDQFSQSAAQEESVQLQVLVVSSEGIKLAGVPVSLWTIFEGRLSNHPWKEGVTNESGLATLHLPPPPKDYDRSIAVGFPFPCGSSKPAHLLRSELPAEPITLTLAATGAVEVQLLDADGNPWIYPMSVILGPSPGLFKDKRIVLRKEGPSYGIAKTNEQGVVVFPHVVLNRALVAGLASVVGAGQWGQWSVEGFAGPGSPGEMTKVQLRLTNPADVIRFRLLDPEGNPVTNRDWSAIITEYTSLPSSFRTQGRQRKQTTDEFGITLCGLPQFNTEVPWTHRNFVLTCVPGDINEKLEATVNLTEDFGPGIHDIGDVQLQPFTALAAGSLVSGTDAKLENLSVRVESEVEILSGSSDFQNWNAIPREVAFEPNGSFQVTGSTSAEKIRLTFQADGFHDLVKVVEAGSSNLNFAFEASFVIAGRLELPEDFDLQRVKMYFVPPGSAVTGSGWSGHVSEAEVRQDGAFTFSGLESATSGEVAVFWGRGETALVRIQDVTPIEAHVAPDARLNPLQIAAIHHYEISFADEDGELLNNMRYRIFKDVDSFDSASSADFQGGTAFINRFTLNIQLQQVKVGYWQAGYAYGEQIVQPGETVLTAKQPILASLKLENSLELPDGMELEAELISDAAGGLASMRETVPPVIPFLLPQIPLPAAGTYGIQLFLKDKETRKEVPVSWEDGSLIKEFVVSKDADQVFRVSFPNHNILLAAEQLKDE